MGKKDRDRTRRRAQERRRKRTKKGARSRGAPGLAFVVDETTGTARQGISFACPDCGVAAVLTHDDAGGPAVIHEEPRCEAFMALEPADYVAWSRRSTMAQAQAQDAPEPSAEQLATEKVWATPPEDALTGRCHDATCAAPNCLDPHASTHVAGDERLVILTYTSPDQKHRVRVNGDELGSIDTRLDPATNPVFRRFADEHGELGIQAFMHHLQQRHRMMHGGLN